MGVKSLILVIWLKILKRFWIEKKAQREWKREEIIFISYALYDPNMNSGSYGGSFFK